MSAVSIKTGRGFSLVELMIATAILAVVAVQMGVGFTGLFRLMRHSYAESEIAIAEHKMHDRLLFNLKPYDSSLIPPGGLTVSNVTITASGIDFEGAAFSLNGTTLVSSPTTCRLVLDSYSQFAIDNDVNSARWLNPANMFSSETDISQIAALTNDNKVLTIDISMRMRDDNVSRAQRVTIPIFGRIQ